MPRLAIRESGKTSKRQVCFLFSILVLAGCNAGQFSSYTSPRVSGQVIAANTQLPLSGVRISRHGPLAHRNSGEAAKGSQLMVKDFVIRTDEQGKFTVEAESVLTPFRQRTWTSVGLSFAHKGYVSFHTNYSIASGSEFASDGVPLVQLGQIALRPTRPPTTK